MIRRLAPLRHAVGPLLFCVIAMRIDRAAVLDALSHASLDHVMAASLVVLLALPLRAARWRGILLRMGHGVGAYVSLRLYASGTFAGTATPGRVGEAYKIAPLVSRGVPSRMAVASVVLDRVCDLAVAASVAALYLASTLRGAAAAAAAAVALSIAIVALAGFLAGADAELSRRSRSGELRGTRGMVQEALAAVAGPEALARTLALTALASASAWIANHLLVGSLDLPLGPFETAGVSAAAALATVLPVSVLGVGTRDAALLVLLARYAITPADALALSTLFLALNLWTGLACGLVAILPGGKER